MVGLDISKFSRHSGALDERQQVALHSFSRNSFAQIAQRSISHCQLVDFIQKDDSILLYHFDSLTLDVQIGEVAFQSLVVGAKQKGAEFLNSSGNGSANEVRLFYIKVGSIARHDSYDVIVVVSFFEVAEFLLAEFGWQAVSDHCVEYLKVDLVLDLVPQLLCGLLHLRLQVSHSDLC